MRTRELSFFLQAVIFKRKINFVGVHGIINIRQEFACIKIIDTQGIVFDFVIGDDILPKPNTRNLVLVPAHALEAISISRAWTSCTF